MGNLMRLGTTMMAGQAVIMSSVGVSDWVVICWLAASAVWLVLSFCQDKIDA